MSRTSYLRPLVLLLAAAVAVSVLMVLWSTLPVQAQSESAVNDTGDAQPTGKHLIAFKDTELPQDYRERIAALGGSVDAEYPAIGVAVASGLSDAAADSLGSDEDVEVVEQDVEFKALDPIEEAPAEVAAAEDAPAEVEPASQTNPTTAFFYPRQWHLQAIKADKAWANGRLGNSNVTVAILDTGIDGGTNASGTNAHPDLLGRVDRTRSKSFVPEEDPLVAARFGPNAPAWTDLHYHGTHVAATVSSNALATAGVTSKVKLMAVKVFNRFGGGSRSAVLAGVMYAADNGADLINLSLGGYFRKSETPGSVAVINRAFNHAKRTGTAIVVSAGNESLNLDKDSNGYKTYCQSPHVVCVSATGPTSGGVNGPWTNIDATASYSNYGAPITVAAPGGNVGGSAWAACSRTSLAIPVCRTGTFILGLQGTSMAAPHATGLAALLVEDIAKRQPSQVAAQVRKSADDRGKPGEDAFYGHGRINVANALGLE